MVGFNGVFVFGLLSASSQVPLLRGYLYHVIIRSDTINFRLVVLVYFGLGWFGLSGCPSLCWFPGLVLLPSPSPISFSLPYLFPQRSTQNCMTICDFVLFCFKHALTWTLQNCVDPLRLQLPQIGALKRHYINSITIKDLLHSISYLCRVKPRIPNH